MKLLKLKKRDYEFDKKTMWYSLKIISKFKNVHFTLELICLEKKWIWVKNVYLYQIPKVLRNMIKRKIKSQSKNKKKFARITDHARVLDIDQRFAKIYNKRKNKEAIQSKNKDNFARIIYVGNCIENSNKNQTYVDVIVFTDKFAISKIRIFSTDEFILDQNINLGEKNRIYHIKIMKELTVNDLSLNSFQLLQNILCRRFNFEEIPTKNVVTNFLKSHRPKKSEIGKMPKIRHRVYLDHGLQFPNG